MGKTSWDDAVPRHVADGDGVRYAGPLHSPAVKPLRKIAARLVKYRLLPDACSATRSATTSASSSCASSRRPRSTWRAGGTFTVVVWDDTPADGALADRLAARGTEGWRVSALLPGVDRGSLMIPGDTHPGPELSRLLADALAARLTAPAAATSAAQG